MNYYVILLVMLGYLLGQLTLLGICKLLDWYGGRNRKLIEPIRGFNMDVVCGIFELRRGVYNDVQTKNR